jgi:hypothetical protein
MKVKSFALAGSVVMAVLIVLPVVSIKAPRSMWWFEYEDMSIRWWAHLTDDKFCVDLDGDHSTFALIDTGYWTPEYGSYALLGVAKRFVWNGAGTVFGWAFLIGELKIDQRDAHIHETYGGGYITEWFYYRISKPNPPTNWMITLQGSDGTNPIPVTGTFWFSEDGGNTWNSFTP